MSRRIALVAAALACIAAVALPVSAQADEHPTYVALGDSFAAGPVIPMQEQPWGCLKSTNNYAKHLAARLGYELRDATCSGASTKHMYEWHGVSPEEEFGQGGNPPQLDSLDASVDLVTLQIGGNDIGFGGIAQTCAEAGFQQRPCKGEYVTQDENGEEVDRLQDRIDAAGPKVGAVIAAIQERAPEARVLVLGYSGIFAMGETASCPAMLVGEDDAQYLRSVQERLNGMIAEQAALNGGTYVDVYGPSAGHTACDAPVIRWVEPIVPVNAAAPVHPNLTGMLAVADVLETVVRSDDAGAALSCPADMAGRQSVLLVHGTGVTPEENWGWGYLPDLTSRGYAVCTVQLPERALNDIQESAPLVAEAIRTMFDASGGKVHVLGHSQGGLVPRWALRWWPDLREMVDDVVTLGAPHHGTTAARYGVAGNTCEACHQMRDDSDFIAALNSWDETPGDISYTSIWTQYDQLVQPPSSANLAGADTDPAVSNVRIQDLGGFCTWRTVDHLGLASDAVAHALVLDAFTNDGPALRTRVPASVCSQVSFTSSPTQLLTATQTSGPLFLGQVVDEQGSLPTGARQAQSEPPLAHYVGASVVTVDAPAGVQVTDDLDVTATLHDAGGQPLAGRSITFTLGDQAVTATTDATGAAAAALPVDQDAGTATLVAAFAGDESHRSSEAGRMVEVLHEDTVLTYVGDTHGRGDEVELAASLTDADGIPIAGRTVVFDVGGAETTATTGEDGRASVTVAIADHGRSVQVTATFAGDARFLPDSTTATITWGRT